MNKGKKVLAIFCLIVLSFVVVFGGIYVALGFYYQDGFAYGTWINGIYATGKSVSDINKELIAKSEYNSITVIASDSQDDLSLEKVDMQLDYTSELNRIIKSQSPFLWGYYYFENSYYDIKPSIELSSAKLTYYAKRLSIFDCVLYDESNTVSVLKTEEGYVLKDDTKNVLKQAEAIEKIEEAVKRSEISVSIEDCYCDMETPGNYDKILSEWRKIDNFQRFETNLLMADGKEVHIGPKETSEWMLLDENGEFVLDEGYNITLDEEKVTEYVAEIAKQYNTIDKIRDFATTSGKIETFEGGTYGNKIDEKSLTEILIEDFNSKLCPETVEVPYSQLAWSQDENDDIGDTYIEVDMGNQHLYYYKDGALLMESDVVTGKLSNGCGTPKKMCYVYNKARNRTLRGPGYASFVYYWMGAYGGIGFHDATWRKAFGGTIYKNSGSHGCINLPKKFAGEFYNEVEVGTPVVLYY